MIPFTVSALKNLGIFVELLDNRYRPDKKSEMQSSPQSRNVSEELLKAKL